MRNTLIIAGVLLISLLTGCLDLRMSDYEVEELIKQKTKTIVIDGCDYLYDTRRGQITAHKGNCRRCANK